jgi:hypothetical protein
MSASDWMRQLRITCGLEARRTRPAKWALLSLVSKNTLSLQQGERCKISFPHDTQLRFGYSPQGYRRRGRRVIVAPAATASTR